MILIGNQGLLYLINTSMHFRSDEGLALETSAFKLFTIF